MPNVRHHKVVLKKEGGGVEIHPLKEWIRKHCDELPGMDPSTDTSHQLRNALERKGWVRRETTSDVFSIKPADDGDTSYADEFLGEEPEIPDDEDSDEVIEAEGIGFGLERDLQSALRENIGQLEQGLTIVDEGKERVTEAGEIDITARDTNGNLVVIELKPGTAPPKVIAQTLSYMTALRQFESKPVRGIIVARDFHKQVKLAALQIPNLQLRRYSIKFTFQDVD